MKASRNCWHFEGNGTTTTTMKHLRHTTILRLIDD
jgi:hypothetical protein